MVNVVIISISIIINIAIIIFFLFIFFFLIEIFTELKNIRNAFKNAMFTHILKNKFTIKSMTDLRPLSETNDTGFLYRYEFDITCGYNEIITTELEQSQGVIIDLEPNNIHIEVNKENMHV